MSYNDEERPVVSIPTKYQTKVFLNTMDEKGFLSKTNRFVEKWDDIPGPGAYTAKGSRN